MRPGFALATWFDQDPLPDQNSFPDQDPSPRLTSRVHLHHGQQPVRTSALTDMNLEAESLKRKERLNAIRNRRARPADDQDENRSGLRFRNYTPVSEDIKSFKDEKDGSVDTIRQAVKEVEKQVHTFAKDAVKEEEQRSKEVDLFSLAPKKANWDLKRDLETKLEKLERKTLHSIADLIRARLQADNDVTDIGAAGADQGSDDDDD
ncbi:cwf18 pre-mRNA splicing factor-domain-containing protein, partial [Polychytrium aggregatum]|uniref:cwf18 pre-mRNA splicing factor-domain-containing protein n=1 Tax=Polychytrium aggregatum TaxID=110093 RepID=UPI0022FE95F0